MVLIFDIILSWALLWGRSTFYIASPQGGYSKLQVLAVRSDRPAFVLSLVSHYEMSISICQAWHLNLRLYVTMSSRKERRQEGNSPLEALRINKTDLSQDEFAFRCGIPRATYHRWISGATEPKFSLFQLKAICRELKIEKIDELPESFGPN